MDGLLFLELELAQRKMKQTGQTCRDYYDELQYSELCQFPCHLQRCQSEINILYWQRLFFVFHVFSLPFVSHRRPQSFALMWHVAFLSHGQRQRCLLILIGV